MAMSLDEPRFRGGSRAIDSDFGIRGYLSHFRGGSRAIGSDFGIRGYLSRFRSISFVFVINFEAPTKQLSFVDYHLLAFCNVEVSPFRWHRTVFRPVDGPCRGTSRVRWERQEALK